MNATDLRAEVSKITWYHSIPLAHGVVTPGVDDTPSRLPKIHMSEDLSGKTVLDVGAWDGFFSFEAERRGASRVLATNSFSWSGEGWGTKDGFELARRALDPRSKIARSTCSICRPTRSACSTSCCSRRAVPREAPAARAGARVLRDAGTADHEHLRRRHLDAPAGRGVLSRRGGNRDPTNWWGPNPAAVIAMLETAGFTRVDLVDGPTPFRKRLKVGIRRSLGGGAPILPTLWQGAVVCHARP